MSHLPTPSLPSSPAAPAHRSASLASMKATRRAEWKTIDWRFRYGVPLLLPTAFFAVFALSGLVELDAPALTDAVVVAHEALDPVGTGRSSSP